MFDHDLGHLCRGMRTQMSGHFGFLSSFGASSILLGCTQILRRLLVPLQPGSLEMISMTFAAVICDADEPSSVNTRGVTVSSAYQEKPTKSSHLAPQVHRKKPLDLTHSKFEKRSRTTRSRVLQSFALPDEPVHFQQS